jgi:hypothetical protein
MTPGNRLNRRLVTSGFSIPAFVVASLTSSMPSGASAATTIVPSDASTRTTVTPAPAGSCKNSQFRMQSSTPAFVRRILRAVPLQSTPSSLPNDQPFGVLVPEADIVAAAANGDGILFGLTLYRDLMEATYPAISTDGGTSWRIDGPLFWVAAADAPNVTSNVGALGSQGAYYWGQGGNFVRVTTDEGHHWSLASFDAGVYKVSASHGILRTVALGNQVSCTDFQAFLYVSTNSGRTWNLHGQLRDVRP